MLHVRWIAIALLGCLALTTGALSAQDKKDEKKKSEKSDDVTIVGQIVDNDIPDKVRKFPCKIHTLKFAKDKTYQIDLESSDFDAYLRVEDAAGKQLAFNDDCGEGLNSRLRFTPEKDGGYQIIATTFSGGAGTYTLKVRSAAVADKKEPLAPAADGKVHTVGDGLKIEGRITKDDPKDRVRRQSNAKVYQVKMTAGKTYTIDMETQGDDLDPFLRLEDMTGKHLESDDDGGDNLNARITHRAKADGTYRIIATTFGGGDAGAFVLKVRGE
jgi:hypothetical protein